MHPFRDSDLEISDNRRRGEMPHLKRIISEFRTTLQTLGTCARCREKAMALVDAYGSPRAVCARHAEEWRRMSPVERRQARLAFTVRG
jgi:hypothetical protein